MSLGPATVRLAAATLNHRTLPIPAVPDFFEGTDLLSDDPDVNPLLQFSHVDTYPKLNFLENAQFKRSLEEPVASDSPVGMDPPPAESIPEPVISDPLVGTDPLPAGGDESLPFIPPSTIHAYPPVRFIEGLGFKRSEELIPESVPSDLPVDTGALPDESLPEPEIPDPTEGGEPFPPDMGESPIAPMLNYLKGTQFKRFIAETVPEPVIKDPFEGTAPRPTDIFGGSLSTEGHYILPNFGEGIPFKRTLPPYTVIPKIDTGKGLRFKRSSAGQERQLGSLNLPDLLEASLAGRQVAPIHFSDLLYDILDNSPTPRSTHSNVLMREYVRELYEEAHYMTRRLGQGMGKTLD